MTRHKQVRIKGYGQEADVDEGIANLILEMWRCRIKTFMSCQEGRDGFVWLNFETAKEAEKFMDIVADDYDPVPGSMYQRMVGPVHHPDNWFYNTHADDWHLIMGDDQTEEEHLGQPDFVFSLSIWFPPSDLPAVMEKLIAYRKAKRKQVSPAPNPGRS